MWLTIPSKQPELAKRRLASLLSPDELRSLHFAMLEDVLSAAVGVSGLDGICVITICPDVAAMAQRYGALVLQESALRGHRKAVALAARHLKAEGVDQMMTLPGDVPMVTSQDIEKVLSAHNAPNMMTFVPDYCELGSNCVILNPDAAPALRIGSGKFSTHIRAAGEFGFDPQILRNPNIAQDIDTPDDLLVLLRHDQETRAGRYILESGIPRRIPGAESRTAIIPPLSAIMEFGT